jgi:hypothetical protein
MGPRRKRWEIYHGALVTTGRWQAPTAGATPAGEQDGPQ